MRKCLRKWLCYLLTIVILSGSFSSVFVCNAEDITENTNPAYSFDFADYSKAISCITNKSGITALDKGDNCVSLAFDGSSTSPGSLSVQDPYFSLNLSGVGTSVTATSYPYIAFRVKTNIQNMKMQVRASTSTDNNFWTMMENSVQNTDEWQTVVMDCTKVNYAEGDHANWKNGYFTGMRIDFYNADGDKLEYADGSYIYMEAIGVFDNLASADAFTSPVREVSGNTNPAYSFDFADYGNAMSCIGGVNGIAALDKGDNYISLALPDDSASLQDPYFSLNLSGVGTSVTATSCPYIAFRVKTNLQNVKMQIRATTSTDNNFWTMMESPFQNTSEWQTVVMDCNKVNYAEGDHANWKNGYFTGMRIDFYNADGDKLEYADNNYIYIEAIGVFDNLASANAFTSPVRNADKITNPVYSFDLGDYSNAMPCMSSHSGITALNKGYNCISLALPDGSGTSSDSISVQDPYFSINKLPGISTTATAISYPYIAFRVKTNIQNMKMQVRASTSTDNNFWTTMESAFQNTDKWQTVVVDCNKALYADGDHANWKNGCFTGMRIDFYNADGDKLEYTDGSYIYMEAIGVFSDYSSANAYSGPVRDVSENTNPAYSFDFGDYNRVMYCDKEFNGITSFENGEGCVSATLPDNSGLIQDAKFSIHFPYANTNAIVKNYPYVALRIKTNIKDLTLQFRESTSIWSKYWAVEQDSCQNTDEWQTVVVNCKDAYFANGVPGWMNGYYTGMRLDFYTDADMNGDVLSYNKDSYIYIKSVAFYDNFADASGMSEDIINGDNGAIPEVSDDTWLKESFANPAADYRMTKMKDINTSDYKGILDQLRKLGYGGVVTNDCSDTAYMQNTARFQNFKDAFDYARGIGLTQTWIYDEQGWPSGSAGGQVIKDNPEYESKVLDRVPALSGQTGQTVSYTQTSGDYNERIVYAEVVNDNKPSERSSVSFSGNVVNGTTSYEKWSLYVYISKWSGGLDFSGSMFNTGTRYVNLLDPGVTKSFLDKTHAQYQKYFGSAFNSVSAFYTDEPALEDRNRTTTIPWQASLPEKFYSMHGYSMFDNIRALYDSNLNSDADKMMRINFYQTVGEMLSQNYFKQIEDYTSSYGIPSSGHILFEETLDMHVRLYGNAMKCFRQMGMPGADLLYIDPVNMLSNCHMSGFMGVKYSNSAARNTGKSRSFIEFNPEAVSSLGENRLEASIGGLTFSTFLGATNFCMLNPQNSYTESEQQKLNEYLGRINTILNNANMTSGLAVYYPISTLQANYTGEDNKSISLKINNVCRTLLKNQLDYNILDEDSILDGTTYVTDDGKLAVGTDKYRSEYKVVVIPDVLAMSCEAMKTLDKFVSKGGSIIWLGGTPSLETGMNNSTGGDKAALFKKLVQQNVTSENSFESLSSAVIKKIKGLTGNYDAMFGGLTSNTFVSPYKKENKEIFYIANVGNIPAPITVNVDTDESYSIYDPYTGGIWDSSKLKDNTFICKGYQGIFVVKCKNNGKVVTHTETNTTVTPATLAPNNGAITITPEVTNNIAKVELDPTDYKALLDSTTAVNGIKNVSITINNTSSSSYNIQLPVTALTNSSKDAAITINTAIAKIVVPSNMFDAAAAKGATDIGINVVSVDKSALPAGVSDKIGSGPVADISATMNGTVKDWNNPDAPVSISIPYTLNKGESGDYLTVYYIDGTGNLKNMQGVYDSDTKMVTFSTTHFSKYFVKENKVSFTDLNGFEHYTKYIEAMASKGIINGVGNNQYAPGKDLTRAEFTVLLVKMLKLDITNAGNVFEDIKSSDWYTPYINAAYNFGLIKGVGSGAFAPNKAITNQDAALILVKALKYQGLKIDTGSLSKVKDTDRINKYALDAVGLCVSNGIIPVDANGNFNAKSTVKRASIAEYIYNVFYFKTPVNK